VPLIGTRLPGHVEVKHPLNIFLRDLLLSADDVQFLEVQLVFSV
jgi:hypothetical protein